MKNEKCNHCGRASRLTVNLPGKKGWCMKCSDAFCAGVEAVMYGRILVDKDKGWTSAEYAKTDPHTRELFGVVA